MGKEPLDVSDKAKVKKRIRDAKNKKKSLSYEEFEEVFALYDTDNNGKLQYAEMNSFMKDLLMRIERSKKSFKKGLTEKEMFKYSQDVANLIQKYDEDRSGTLDKREVAKILNVKIPLNDSYTLQTSVKSRGKLFEGVRGPPGGECQEMPEDTCHDVGGPLQDESDSSEEEDEDEDQEESQQNGGRRGSELLRKGAVKVRDDDKNNVGNNDVSWQAMQKQSFTEWVEFKLSDNNSEYIVMDLVEDLGDGVLLPELTKALTLKDLVYREEPKLTFHRYENIRISLDALKAAGCQFINMDVAGDLVSGNEKLCLSFIKVLLNHFGGKKLDSQPNPGLLNVVNDLQTRMRSRSSESPAPEEPVPAEQEPDQSISNLFQTRSSILPIQEQIAAIQSPQDWPKNRSRSEIPDTRSSVLRGRSHTPEKQPEVFRGRSHTPEKQPDVFRGRSHTPEKQPEVFRGRSHTPENQPEFFRGRSHTPEKQPDVFRARSHTPEKQPDVFRGRSHTPEKQPEVFRGRSHTPEKQPEVFRGRSHTPEKQPDVFRGRSHTPEKQPEVFRGRSHTPEKQPDDFRGRSHTPEKQPEFFRGRSHTPEKQSDVTRGRPNSPAPEKQPEVLSERSQTPEKKADASNEKPEVISQTANKVVGQKSLSQVQTENSHETIEGGTIRMNSPAISVSSTQRFQKNSELLESIKAARPSLKSHVVRERAEVKPIEVVKVTHSSSASTASDATPLNSDAAEIVTNYNNSVDSETPKETEQPDPTLSADKKLEFFLGRGPPLAVIKSRAISRGAKEETPTATSSRPKTPPATPPAESRGQFNPVMSQLIRETRSRQVALENHTSTEMPHQARGRESFLGMGTPARVKMKPTNLVIPQFKQNVVNGLTEIISQVNKIVEDKYERVNNLNSDWADGQIILIITDWFSPGILEAYKHDHSLVKIGVSLATIKQLLDVGTEITPMDMFNSRIEMNEFRRFLSHVLWKNRARHQKPFTRTSEILCKEKEMRNIGMISASLMRRNEKKRIIHNIKCLDVSPKENYRKAQDTLKSPLSQQFVPKQMVQLRPTSPIPETASPRSRTPDPDKVEASQAPGTVKKPTPIEKPVPAAKKISSGVSKVSQIAVSPPVVEDALLSTIPPAKPPRPKFMPSSDISSANAAAPLEDDCVLSTIPKRNTGVGNKRNNTTARDKGSADNRLLVSSFAGPFPKAKPGVEPEPPLRTTSFGRERQHSAPQKPQRGISKITSVSSPDQILEPTPTSSEKFPESSSKSSFLVNVTKDHVDSAGNQYQREEISYLDKTVISGGRRRHDTHTAAELETGLDAECGFSGGEDNASIDSLEQSDIDYIKNVSKMIAGFIDNEVEETVKDSDLLSSPRAKKKVRFQDGAEEFDIKEEESSHQREDLKKNEERSESYSERQVEEKSRDRIDKVGKHLLQDLAYYFSSNVVETDATEETEENTASLKLEDFLPASTHFKTDYDQIDVNKMVFKSLSEAGIRPDKDKAAIEDEEEDEEEDGEDTSQIIELTEKEAQPSYFDIMCRRPSRASKDASDDQGDVRKEGESSFLTPVHF